MKKIIVLLLCAMVSFGASAQKSKEITKQKVTFSVAMDCESCKALIEKNLPFEKGVKDLEVDFAAGKVTIGFDPRKTTKTDLANALRKLDLKVTEDACCGQKKECADKKECCGKKECTDKKCADKKECTDKKCADKKECCDKKECTDKKCADKKDCTEKK